MTENELDLMLREAGIQVRLCEALYSGQSALEAIAEEIGGGLTMVQSAYVKAAVICIHETKFAYVCICGTNDLHDWVQNFSARLRDYRSMQVHSGFAVSAEILLDKMKFLDLFKKLRGKRIILSGHSAGGAIAQLIALQPEFDVEEIYTFGSPRVFSPHAALSFSTYNWSHFRFTLPYDPCPLLPLQASRLMFEGARYAHAAQPITLTDDGEMILEQERTLTSRVWRFVRNIYLTLATIFSFLIRDIPSLKDEHFIGKYSSSITTIIRKHLK